MMLAAWSSSRAALQSPIDCALSQVGTCPDMTFGVARMENAQQANNQPLLTHRSLKIVEGGLSLQEVVTLLRDLRLLLGDGHLRIAKQQVRVLLANLH